MTPYVFSLLLMVSLLCLVDNYPTRECSCGYGGLCLSDERGKALNVSCKLCSKISKGFYDEDCYSITDHCLRYPCQRGRCVSTFGGYFCECPRGFIGQQCETEAPDFSNYDFQTQAHVYYQVQPGRKGTQKFTVIVDDSIFANIELIWPGAFVNVILDVTNGPTFFPELGTEFVQRNVKKECLLESQDYSEVKDSRVCEYVPEGNVWAFSFDLTRSVKQIEQNEMVVIPEVDEPIGFRGSVNVGIFIERPGDVPTELYLQEYNIFFYKYQRAPNNCGMTYNFVGCSAERHSPSIYVRQYTIKVSVSRQSICKGVQNVQSEWYLQSLVNYKDLGTYASSSISVTHSRNRKDPVPVELHTVRNLETITFDPLFFDLGLNMLVFGDLMRGDPPHTGGTTMFQKFGRCWLKVLPGVLQMSIHGGHNRTAPCYQPLKLSFFSLNPSIRVTDLMFVVSCNHTNDEECESSILEVPVIRKLTTPCDQYYQFDIHIAHDYSHSYQKIVSVIHFIRSSRQLTIECFFNCNPITPSWKTIWIAFSQPYDPEPVKWNVTWDGIDVTNETEDVETFKPLSASRIFILKEKVLLSKEPKNYVNDIIFHVSSLEGAYAQSPHVIDYLIYRVQEFHLERSPGGQKFVLNSGKGEFPLPPERYGVYQRYWNTLDKTLFVQTTDINKLEFKPNTHAVVLCIEDGWLSRACSGEFKINETVEIRNHTIEEYYDILYSGNWLKLMNDINMQFYQDLSKGELEPKFFSWTLSLSFRTGIVKMLQKISTRNLKVVHWEAVGSILKKMFYTTDGNAVLDGHPFKNDDIAEYKALKKWMSLRKTSLKLLLKCMRSLMTVIPPRHWDTAERILGVAFRVLLYAMSSSLYGLQALHRLDPNQFDYYTAELQSENIKNARLVFTSLSYYEQSLAIYLPLYYDLKVYGNFQVRTWALKSSFNGIAYHLNRENETDNKRSEDKFFGPFSEQQLWLHVIDLQLPPCPPDLESKELTFSAIVSQRRTYKTDATPTVQLTMRLRNGNVISRFSNNATYRIVLPIFGTGNIWDSRAEPFKRNVVATFGYFGPKPNDFRTYKITLPSKFAYLMIEFTVDLPIEYFKFKIESARVPTYQDTSKEQKQSCKLRKPSVNYCAHAMLEHKGKIPTMFYVGIIIKRVDRRPVQVQFKTYAYVCRVHTVTFPWIKPSLCKTLREPQVHPSLNTKGNRSLELVQCACGTFGSVSAITGEIRYGAVLSQVRIQVNTNKAPTTEVITTVLATVFVVCIIATGFIMDKRRLHKDSLRYLEDNYRNDKFAYVIGVFTSGALFAGTKSAVAIKLEGARSSSRVHLLKSIPGQSLETASDRWFVMTSKEPLGRMTHVHMWHDYRCLSYWKCDRILIYDVATELWHSASVNEWLKIQPSNEMSRSIKVACRPFTPGSGQFKLSVSNFAAIFGMEIRNKHFLFSLFCMHPRILGTCKERGLALLVKELSIVLMIWVIHESPELIRFFTSMNATGASSFYIPVSETISVAIVLSILSRSVTMPFHYSFRRTYITGFFQKKCTNPQDKLTVSRAKEQFMRKRSSAGISRDQIDLRRRSSRFVSATGSLPRSKSDYEGQTILIPNTVKVSTAMIHAAFGPSQFRCVNVDGYLLSSKAHAKGLVTRCLMYGAAAAIFIALLVGTWLSNEREANPCYHMLSEKQCGYLKLSYFVAALVVDAFFLEILVIFFQSVMMIRVLSTTNQEAYYWYEEGRIPPPKRPPMTFEQYIVEATKKNYKPLLSWEIEAVRRKAIYLAILKELVLYLVLISLAIFCLAKINSKNSKFKFISNDSFKRELENGRNLKYLSREKSLSIQEVVDIRTALEYVRYSMPWNNKWPNDKLITKHGIHFANDRKSARLGPEFLIFFVIKNESYANMYRPIKPFFNPALGHLSSWNQEKEPLYYKESKVLYTELRGGHVVGRTGMHYPYKGHCLVIPTDNWMFYYSLYRYMLGLLEKESAIHIVRAIIVSSAFINAYSPLITVADLLLECLPSGVVVPTLKITSVNAPQVENFEYTQFGFFVVIIIILMIFNVLGIARAGWSTFLKTPHMVVRFLIMTMVIVTMWMSASLYIRECELLDTLRYHTQRFVNIHPYKSREHDTSLSLLVLLGLICLEASLFIKRMFGVECLSRHFSNGILPFSGIAVCVLILAFIFESCLFQHEFHHSNIFKVMGREMSAADFALNYQLRVGLAFLIFFLIIGLKTLGATILLPYFGTEVWCESGTTFGRIYSALRERNQPVTAAALKPDGLRIALRTDDRLTRRARKRDSRKVQLVNTQRSTASEAREKKYEFLLI